MCTIAQFKKNGGNEQEDNCLVEQAGDVLRRAAFQEVAFSACEAACEYV